MNLSVIRSEKSEDGSEHGRLPQVKYSKKPKYVKFVEAWADNPIVFIRISEKFSGKTSLPPSHSNLVQYLQ